MSEEIEKSFTTERYIASYPVLNEHDNLRLDQFIMACMPTLSRQFLKKKIEKGSMLAQQQQLMLTAVVWQ